jgi:CSLREA domain-containing protein
MRWTRLLMAATVVTGVLALASPAHAATITVNTFADELNGGSNCSLREALASANTDGADPNGAGCTDGSGPDVIALPAGTYLRTTTTSLDVTSPVTIDPTGTVVIDGNGNPLFDVDTTGNLTISDLTLRRGTNTGGGGVLNGGTTVLERVLLEANTGQEGGGVLNVGTFIARNVTFSGNQAFVDGGGLQNEGTATLNNVTFAENVADSDGNGSGNGGGISVASGSVTISNTIAGDNRDQSTGTNPRHDDCSGTLTSSGYNFIEDVEGCTIAGVTTGNITSRNPQLFPLDENGGPTKTHALRQGSDAVDAGNPAAPGSNASACEMTDQRGTRRPQGSRCDIGAFERESPSDQECQNKKVTLSGTSGNDVITGTAKRDVIHALGGDDVIDALGGNDRVCAGGGNDKVRGRAGNDQATAGSGDDRLIGAGGGDTLSGQGGKDRLKGKGGNDALKGGPKPDKLNGGGGTDICQGGGGKDQISGCEG